MAHVTPQREGAIAAPMQQELPSTSEIPAADSAGTRALLIPVDDTDVSYVVCTVECNSLI